MARFSVPFMVISPNFVSRRLMSLKSFGMRLKGVYPGLEYDMRNAGIRDFEPEIYSLSAFLSALVLSTLFALFIRILVQISTKVPRNQLVIAPVVAFAAMLVLMFALFLFYPKILAGKIASQTDKELIYAVRDILVQVKSGIPLDFAMKNVAQSNYGTVSLEFGKLVQDITTGKSMTSALEEMALRTQSEYLKKTTWQLVTTIRAGANVTAALKSIVTMLHNYQFSLIKSYNAELNFLVLIYLLIAAVVPTVGITVLVIFSVFGILGITPEIFMMVVGFSFFVQFLLALFIFYQRPNIY